MPLVVPVEGKLPSEADLLAFYENKVAKWQIPDKVVLVEALPLGGTGKILKNVLREKYAGVLDTETSIN